MTITELATLEIVSPFSWDSPEIQSFFRAASESQSAWSGYPLFFFQDKCVVKEIYLLSGWESVEAHMDWIASPRNKELLKLGEGLFHVASLVHMNIDFSKIPRDTTYIVWGQHERAQTHADGHGGNGWKAKGEVLDVGKQRNCTIWAYGKEGERELTERKVVNMGVAKEMRRVFIQA